jgi:acyl carrier protein
MEKRVYEIINKVLENRSRKKIPEFHPEMHLWNDIGFDSLDLAELTVRLEAEYEVDIFEDGIVSTVGELFAKLKKE